MQTRTDEITNGIFRFSTYVDRAGLTFNQYLILAEQPLLFHCGLRNLFPLISTAMARVMPVNRLRWISFGHVEADELGGMNDWLKMAPNAEVAFGAIGCAVSVNDLAARPPRPLENGEVIDLGGRRVRYIATPHVPHGWDAGLFFEETTQTLLCGDLFTHMGDIPARTSGDIVGPAFDAEEQFHYTALAPHTASAILALKQFAPKLLALMHGSAFDGDCDRALTELAAGYDARVRHALA